MHGMTELDREIWFLYCQLFQNLIQNGVSTLLKVNFTDEAWFYMSNLHIHSQNKAVRCVENPHLFCKPASILITV
jgi:hypothetical protein